MAQGGETQIEPGGGLTGLRRQLGLRRMGQLALVGQHTREQGTPQKAPDTPKSLGKTFLRNRHEGKKSK